MCRHDARRGRDAEIVGGTGLILPSITRVQPHLSMLAAAGLLLVMAGAAVFHARRDEGASMAPCGTRQVRVW